MLIILTILVFWSLSVFVLRVVPSRKKIYLKGTNMFVLRQLNNKINTTVASMSVICLMLFMTITILSFALSLRNTMQKDLLEMTPVDLNLYKTANLPDIEKLTDEAIADSKISLQETLTNNGFDMNNLKDVVEIPIYATNELTMEKTLGEYIDKAKSMPPIFIFVFNFNASFLISVILSKSHNMMYSSSFKEYCSSPYNLAILL